MGKFCRSCGAKLSEGTKFCSQCGASTAQAQAGRPTPPRPQQGTPIQAAQQPPAPQSRAAAPGNRPPLPQQQNAQQRTMPAQRLTPAQAQNLRPAAPPAQQYAPRPQQLAQPAPQQPAAPMQAAAPANKAGQATSQQPAKAQRPPKKYPVLNALIIFFAVTVFVECIVAGFWFPGFFTSGQSYAAKYGKQGSASAAGKFFAADELPLRYTKQQIDSAPSETCKITTAENTAQAGKVSVHFRTGAAEKECDMVVKDLPQLSTDGDKEGSAIIKGYDFSLSSGQESFATEVEVRIPCTTREGETGRCLWFNEKENKWENIYSELTEDGSQYRIYTTHFSDYAEYKYVFDTKSLKLRKSSKKELFNLDDGIFHETGYNNEIWHIEQHMWAMNQKKTEYDSANIGDKVKNVAAWEKDYAYLKKIYRNGDYGSLFFGGGSTFSSVFDLANLAADSDAGKVFKTAGIVCSLADVTLTSFRIYNECVSGGGTSKSFIKACDNHNLDLASAGLSATGLTLTAMGASSGPLGIAVSVSGCVLYAYSIFNNIYDALFPKSLEEMLKAEYIEDLPSKDPLKAEENFYRYYLTHEKIGFSKKGIPGKDLFDYCLIDQPSCMSDEEFDMFRRYYAASKHHWVGFGFDSEYTRKQKDGKLRQFKNKNYIDVEFNPTSDRDWISFFTSLMLSVQDPANFNNALDEMLNNIAWAYWRMPKSWHKKYLKDNKDFFERHGFNVSGLAPWKLSRGKQLAMVEEVKTKLKDKFYPLIPEAARQAQHAAYKNYLDELDKLVKYLNTPIEFIVEDEDFDNFKESPYYLHYSGSKYNNKLDTSKGKPYAKDLHVSMRFHGVKKPVFFPMGTGFKKKEKTEYYPYQEDFFMPSRDGRTKMTVYRYLQMGAPTKMDFYNPDELNNKNPGCKTIDMVFPETITPGEPITVKVTVSSKKQRWVMDQIVYPHAQNGTIITQTHVLEGDTFTYHRSYEKTGTDKHITFKLPPAEIDDLKELETMKNFHAERLYLYAILYSAKGGKKTGAVFSKDGKLSSPQSFSKCNIQPGDAFYIEYNMNTLTPYIGVRYVPSSSASPPKPKIIDSNSISYGASGKWKEGLNIKASTKPQPTP